MGAMLELIVGSFEKRERLPALQFSCCFMYFFCLWCYAFFISPGSVTILSRGFLNMFTGKSIKDISENKRRLRKV